MSDTVTGRQPWIRESNRYLAITTNIKNKKTRLLDVSHGHETLGRRFLIATVKRRWSRISVTGPWRILSCAQFCANFAIFANKLFWQRIILLTIVIISRCWPCSYAWSVQFLFDVLRTLAEFVPNSNVVRSLASL